MYRIPSYHGVYDWPSPPPHNVQSYHGSYYWPADTEATFRTTAAAAISPATLARPGDDAGEQSQFDSREAKPAPLRMRIFPSAASRDVRIVVPPAIASNAETPAKDLLVGIASLGLLLDPPCIG